MQGRNGTIIVICTYMHLGNRWRTSSGCHELFFFDKRLSRTLTKGCHELFSFAFFFLLYAGEKWYQKLLDAAARSRAPLAFDQVAVECVLLL